MTIKEKIYTFLITILAILLVLSNYFTNKYVSKAQNVYAVYLNGNIVGYIQDDKELYDIINNRQKEIMKKYNVNKVYPPKNFKIVRMNTYNAVLSEPDDIYGEMSSEEGFAIEGYKLIIKSETETKEINFLEREVLDEAVHEYVKAFVSEEEYTNFMNNTQRKIETTGKIIDLMYFDETLTVKKDLISVSEKIYTNVNDLTHYFLFGKDYKISHYIIKEGDTIETVSFDNKLNSKEFLIANPKYASVNSLLAVGDEVNITLLNPEITLTYESTEVEDITTTFEKKIIYDSSKPSNYSQVTTPGVNGITRIKQHKIIKNGVIQPNIIVEGENVLVQKVDQVTTKGRAYIINPNQSFGVYVDDGTDWAWPTNSPYTISSGYEWRYFCYRNFCSRQFHDGIDIILLGGGYPSCGSPIYAAADGIVQNAQWGGMAGSAAGYNVVIEHSNGYWTLYAHLSRINVSVGQTVNRKQEIGRMGTTGVSTGCHLHFGVSNGKPYGGGRFFNPLQLWK